MQEIPKQNQLREKNIISFPSPQQLLPIPNRNCCSLETKRPFNQPLHLRGGPAQGDSQPCQTRNKNFLLRTKIAVSGSALQEKQQIDPCPRERFPTQLFCRNTNRKQHLPPRDEPRELGTHLPEVSSRPPQTNVDPQENGAEQGGKAAAGEVGHGEKPPPNPCSDTIFPGILELFLSRVWKCHRSRGEREAPPGSSGGAGSGKAPEFRPEEEPCQHHLLQRGLPRICSFTHNQGEKQTVKARLYPIFSSRLSHKIPIFSQ